MISFSVVSTKTLLRGIQSVKLAGTATNQVTLRKAARSMASDEKAGKPLRQPATHLRSRVAILANIDLLRAAL